MEVMNRNVEDDVITMESACSTSTVVTSGASCIARVTKNVRLGLLGKL